MRRINNLFHLANLRKWMGKLEMFSTCTIKLLEIALEPTVSNKNIHLAVFETCVFRIYRVAKRNRHPPAHFS